jgi:DNA-binding transcriptional regulator YiaG
LGSLCESALGCLLLEDTESTERVRELRKSLGLSQENFSRLLGVAVQTVNRWENGLAAPSGLADSLLESLGKVVASGQSPKLLEEFLAGEFGGGSPKAFHRIFSLAFGVQPPASAHR